MAVVGPTRGADIGEVLAGDGTQPLGVGEAVDHHMRERACGDKCLVQARNAVLPGKHQRAWQMAQLSLARPTSGGSLSGSSSL